MEINRILVIQTGKLGDMVCTTPVFRAIKMRYPEALLVVVGDSVNREVLMGNPHVDEYVLVKELSGEYFRNFDAAVLLNPNPQILWFLLRSKIKKVIVPTIVGGYSPYFTMKYRILSIFAHRIDIRMHHYAPQEYLNMLVPLGIRTKDTRKEVFASKTAELKAKQILAPYSGRKKIAIAPGAGNKIKEWPPTKFAECARMLNERTGGVIILIGSGKDAALAEPILNLIPTDSIFNTIGALTIDELKALLKEVDLFVSADTGPIYIAEAWGVPTVDIVGPVDEREQPPQGPKHVVVLPPERSSPQLFVMNARVYDVEKASALASSTPVDSVVEAGLSLLS